jgi:hypothetical protein
MMYYKEFLRVRNALLWFTVTLALITGFILIIAVTSKPDPEGGALNVVTPVQQTQHGAAAAPAKADDIPWVVLLGGAGLIAAIMATVLGSSLARENDHLEVAWTKPRSRTRYATALMVVDAAGIIIAQLIAFAFIVTPILLLAKVSRIVGGPDDALNAIRFVLFPLAWYGLIVALSASVRGRAGMVQGLIWPVALGLAALSAAPLPGIWHRIFAAINFINPMSYITYHDRGSDVQIVTGAGLPSVVLAVTVLALMVAASWFAAMFQWRRLQA